MDNPFYDFKDRDDKLKAIIRYNMPKFTPMFYRTNLLTHSARVNLLVRSALPSIKSNWGMSFNSEKACTLAFAHDDAEIISGDVLRYQKDRMTKQELEANDRKEASAIEEICKGWPEKVNGFVYKDLLYHAMRKDCLEAQAVSYLDKVDAYCESLHEVLAGNWRFAGCFVAYIRHLNEYPVKFPALKAIAQSDNPLLSTPPNKTKEEMLAIAKKSGLHTRESVQNPTGFSHYNLWRDITIKFMGVDELVCTRERD